MPYGKGTPGFMMSGGVEQGAKKLSQKRWKKKHMKAKTLFYEGKGGGREEGGILQETV